MDASLVPASTGTGFPEASPSSTWDSIKPFKQVVHIFRRDTKYNDSLTDEQSPALTQNKPLLMNVNFTLY